MIERNWMAAAVREARGEILRTHWDGRLQTALDEPRTIHFLRA